MSKETEDYINELKKEYEQIDIVSKGSSLTICMVNEGIAKEYPDLAQRWNGIPQQGMLLPMLPLKNFGS